MSQSTHQSTDHKRQSQDKNQNMPMQSLVIFYVLLDDFWDWLLFWTISSYVMEKPLSLGLLILILATLFIKRAKIWISDLSYIRYYCRFAFVCSFYDLLTKFRSRSIL